MFSTSPNPSELRNYEPRFSHLRRRDGTTPMGLFLSCKSDAGEYRSTNLYWPLPTVKASPTLPGCHPLCFILASELSLEDLSISSFLVARRRLKKRKCMITVPKPWAGQVKNPQTTYKVGAQSLPVQRAGQAESRRGSPSHCASTCPAPPPCFPPPPPVPTLPQVTSQAGSPEHSPANPCTLSFHSPDRKHPYCSLRCPQVTDTPFRDVTSLLSGKI